jgi:two-component system, NarL family, nitrate/nitrite response regulator NarL
LRGLDGDEAVRKTLELEPDVVVMDISMPSVNGIQSTQEITDRLERTVVIGLSLHDADDLGRAILKAGEVGVRTRRADDDR